MKTSGWDLIKMLPFLLEEIRPGMQLPSRISKENERRNRKRRRKRRDRRKKEGGEER